MSSQFCSEAGQLYLSPGPSIHRHPQLKLVMAVVSLVDYGSVAT